MAGDNGDPTKGDHIHVDDSGTQPDAGGLHLVPQRIVEQEDGADEQPATRAVPRMSDDPLLDQFIAAIHGASPTAIPGLITAIEHALRPNTLAGLLALLPDDLQLAEDLRGLESPDAARILAARLQARPLKPWEFEMVQLLTNPGDEEE